VQIAGLLLVCASLAAISVVLAGVALGVVLVVVGLALERR